MAAQCNLIIDSCCDLPLSMLQIEGVNTLNFNYVMSDGDHEDDFYQSITPHEFYEKIRNGEMPSTSQASPAAIEAAWRRAAENGIPTVYLERPFVELLNCGGVACPDERGIPRCSALFGRPYDWLYARGLARS